MLAVVDSGITTVTESFEITDSWRGTQRALLLTVALVQGRY